MNEMLGGIGRTIWILAGIAVLIGAIFGIVWLGGQLPPALNFVMPHASCNFATTDTAGSYSVTIVAGKNYDATTQSVIGLITKHGGDFLGQSASDQPYQNNAAATSYTDINSIYVTGNIPIAETQAFMNDVAALAPSSDSLDNLSYSKTTGDQLNQNCADDANTIKTSEAMTKIYFREMPTYMKVTNIESSTIPTAPAYYPSVGNTNLDSFNSQVQSSYQNISSSNDSIAQLYQNLNKTSVSITIQDKAQPVYPPNYIPSSNVLPMSSQ